MDGPDGTIVSDLYDGIAEGAQPVAALDRLARRFGCESASIVVFDPVVPQASAFLGIGAFDEVACARYNAEFAALDPAPAAMARVRSGDVFTSTRFFGDDFVRRSPFLHEFLRPLGIEETLVGKMACRDGRIAFLAIHRPAAREDFDNDDLAGLAGYLPHVARALDLRRTLLRHETSLALLEHVIDGLALGLVIRSVGGGVVHVNRAARAIAARHDGLFIDAAGDVHALARPTEAELARSRRRVAEGLAALPVRVPRSGPGSPYVVVTAPVAAGPLGSRGAVLQLIHDPDVETVDSPETVAALCGLPPGAARLVFAMLRGESPADYGRRLGLSYDTVRHHLKVAFARTGTRGQARLLQYVTQLISGLGGRR